MLLAMVALGAIAAAPVHAQAPTPKVTITGLIDVISSWSNNVPLIGSTNFVNDEDTEWYARTRGRFTITGEIAKAKGVLGVEYDLTFGQTGTSDTGGTQRLGTRGGFDLNTDVVGVEEVKWLYIEFPVPLVPIPATLRIGGQPFSVNYKLGTLATGDFAGVNLFTQLGPTLRWHATYAQVEEDLTGREFNAAARGDDFAFITSLEVTPTRGLDLRPTYAFFWSDGTTSTAARVPVGGTPSIIRGDKEERHTVGLDARWRRGPFSLDPTVFYQFGTRESHPAGSRREADISAWLVDVIGGWRVGPVLLEGRFVYASGNDATDDLSRNVDYYQPIDTDTTYFAGGWGEVFPLGIDYFNGAISTLGTGIGLDRYGRIGVAARATYRVTPTFDLRGVVSALWTAEDVDTGVALGTAPTSGGDERYVGTEVNLGITWRFAPGLAFDLVGAWIFAGDALGGTAAGARDPEDVQTIASRVRYTF